MGDVHVVQEECNGVEGTESMGQEVSWAEREMEFVVCNDKEKNLALTKTIKTGHELKGHVEYLHPLAVLVPKDDKEDSKEDQ